jgi:hypothetical protein
VVNLSGFSRLDLRIGRLGDLLIGGLEDWRFGGFEELRNKVRIRRI